MGKVQSARGFTLIELLVVIAIIGLLAGAVVATVNTARTKARDAKRVAQLREVRSALTIYYERNQGYPSSTPATYTGDDAAIKFLVDQGFMGRMPTIPPGGSPTYIYRGIQEDGTECTAEGQICSNFVLGVTLERDDSSALNGDADVEFPLLFYGNSDDCLAAPAGNERCFDFTR